MSSSSEEGGPPRFSCPSNFPFFFSHSNGKGEEEAWLRKRRAVNSSQSDEKYDRPVSLASSSTARCIELVAQDEAREETTSQVVYHKLMDSGLASRPVHDSAFPDVSCPWPFPSCETRQESSTRAREPKITTTVVQDSSGNVLINFHCCGKEQMLDGHVEFKRRRIKVDMVVKDRRLLTETYDLQGDVKEEECTYRIKNLNKDLEVNLKRENDADVWDLNQVVRNPPKAQAPSSAVASKRMSSSDFLML